jgi:transmembrane sensor
MSTEHALYRRQVTAEAAHWFTTMQQRQVPEAERAAFARWLERSALHVEEYLAVASAWRLSGAAADAQVDTARLIEEARTDLANNAAVITLPGRAAYVARRLTRQHTRRIVALKVAAFKPRFVAAAAVAVVAAAVLSWWSLRPESVEYQTRADDQLTATLSDGSTVRLNTSTHVRISLSREYRDVELLEGEALFTVAKDKHRPFRVTSLGSEIRAVGTAFNVVRGEDVTTVTVLEGQVEVAPAGSAARVIEMDRERVAVRSGVVRLVPAQQARVAPGGRLVTTRTVDARAVAAWTQPVLRFSDEPLQEVIARFNRYNTTRLVLEDDELGAVRVSGVFSAADVDSFLAYLDQVEGVTIQPKDPTTRVIQRRGSVHADR